ncbi:MAG: glycosyl transferase [Acaryochloridaceae cyanobacterium RU_4_10]|nr:glycosyl transferase [Acaryochloridaceae cyanobacterium RU_4_10]
MEHYITLFDSLFLPQGLSLHSSLERYAGSYTLWVLCMDDEAKFVLEKLNKPNIKTIALSEIETPKLLAVKSARTMGEYCWTLTPLTPKIVFERDPSIQRVTYLDADLYFLKDINPIFQEFETSCKAILMTDHGYAPEHDRSGSHGQFCVQFMSFIRHRSEPVRAWWEEKCVEWCFDRLENGKFGDQKYLDDWPDRFSDLVHILQRQEWTLAPWNATRFPYSSGKFYHFHGLRILDKNYLHLGNYPLPNPLIKNIYTPYFEILKTAINEISRVGYSVRPQAKKVALSNKLKAKMFLARKLHEILELQPLNMVRFQCY